MEYGIFILLAFLYTHTHRYFSIEFASFFFTILNPKILYSFSHTKKKKKEKFKCPYGPI